MAASDEEDKGDFILPEDGKRVFWLGFRQHTHKLRFGAVNLDYHKLQRRVHLHGMRSVLAEVPAPIVLKFRLRSRSHPDPVPLVSNLMKKLRLV